MTAGVHLTVRDVLLAATPTTGSEGVNVLAFLLVVLPVTGVVLWLVWRERR